MMINLNHELVEQYREKYGITEKYDGELLRLVSVQFPDEIEEEEVAQVVPPLFEVDDFIEDEFEEEAAGPGGDAFPRWLLGEDIIS